MLCRIASLGETFFMSIADIADITDNSINAVCLGMCRTMMPRRWGRGCGIASAIRSRSHGSCSHRVVRRRTFGCRF